MWFKLRFKNGSLIIEIEKSLKFSIAKTQLRSILYHWFHRVHVEKPNLISNYPENWETLLVNVQSSHIQKPAFSHDLKCRIIVGNRKNEGMLKKNIRLLNNKNWKQIKDFKTFWVDYRLADWILLRPDFATVLQHQDSPKKWREKIVLRIHG
jgi:hypothetical protein